MNSDINPTTNEIEPTTHLDSPGSVESENSEEESEPDAENFFAVNGYSISEGKAGYTEITTPVFSALIPNHVVESFLSNMVVCYQEGRLAQINKSVKRVE